ncbi:MAG: YitT family protein [Eubacterium sp.]|nr:YitT family protein [Eubacterium sp.]
MYFLYISKGRDPVSKLKKGILDYTKTGLCIIAGNALLAFLVAAFIIPHNIIMGGTTGIAIVLHQFFPIDTAATVFVLNLALLLFGLIVLGRKFFFTTVASSLLYPVMLALFQRIPNIENLTDDSLLASLFAGVLMGLSLGLVMRVGSSTGGMDVVNLVFHKWFHVPVSILVWITDILVVGGQAIISSSESILLGIVVLVLETLVLDQVMIFGKAQTQLFIVSEKYEEIRRGILEELNFGVTMQLIETGYLNKPQKGVMCVIPTRKLYDTAELVHSIDENAFITITKIKEVRGRGFTQDRITLEKE